MAKHGTSPKFLCQRHLEVGDKVHLNFGFHEDEDLNEDEACEEANDSDEGEDVSTDADNNSQDQQRASYSFYAVYSVSIIRERTSGARVDELGTSTNFLFGARSRHGSAVRFNNRLLF